MPEAMNQDLIVKTLRETGPQTGAELLDHTAMDVLAVWRACETAEGVRLERVGKRFLRLDRSVEGYGRLSPSIRREFLTYTVLGFEDQGDAVREKAERLRREITEISHRKITLAGQTVASALQALPLHEDILAGACFIIAGDITYNMGHAVPRPEVSTGQMVRGSDLDIVVVAADDVPGSTLQQLDDAIYRKKHYLLVHPDYREEIDYLIKSLAKVRTQLRFDTFESMVACKILHEGLFLYGNSSLFHTVKRLLEEEHIPEKLAEMEQRAALNRESAQKSLMAAPPDAREAAFLNLFYTSEEKEEIY